VQTLSYVMMYRFLAKMGHPDVRWSKISSYTLHSPHQFSVPSFRIFLKALCTVCLILSCHTVLSVSPFLSLNFIIGRTLPYPATFG